MSTKRAATGWLVLGAVLAIVSAGCAVPTERMPGPGVEHLPGPASVWLTSEPATPQAAVPVTMTEPTDPDVLFEHTFAPGVTLRGIFATSEGDYRVAALGGTCTLDVSLGPSRIADVVLTLDNGGCSLAVRRFGDMDDPSMQMDEPAFLITNHGVGDEPPVVEPGPNAS